MTIYYVTTGAWGSGTGSPLAASQVDGNFYDVDQRIVTLNANLAVGKRISFVTYTNTDMTFHYTDATTQTIPLPVTVLEYIGPWTNSTPYTRGNLVSVGPSYYQVLEDHTTPASPIPFDPNATDGTTANNPLYSLFLSVVGVPTGGSTGQFLRKVTSANYDINWGDASLDNLSDVAVSTSPIAGEALVYNGTGWVNESLIDQLPLNNLGSLTGTFTLNLSSPQSVRFTMSNNSTIAGFTWPSGSSGKLVRRVIEVVNSGSFTLTWPSASKWPGGVKPTQSASATDVYIIFSSDGGTTVYGNVVGQNYS